MGQKVFKFQLSVAAASDIDMKMQVRMQELRPFSVCGHSVLIDIMYPLVMVKRRIAHCPSFTDVSHTLIREKVTVMSKYACWEKSGSRSRTVIRTP